MSGSSTPATWVFVVEWVSVWESAVPPADDAALFGASGAGAAPADFSEGA